MNWDTQKWHIVIDESGCVQQQINSDGWKEDRYYFLTPDELSKLIGSISSILIGLPDKIGYLWAEESDDGTIVVHSNGRIISVTLAQGGNGAPEGQIKRFYQAVNLLLSKFHVPLSK